jgi:hypothetical protein
MPDAPGGRALVDQHLRRSEEALTASSGGRAVCAISWSADSRPAAKYREGAMSSLAELRRHLRRDHVPDTVEDVVAALADVRNRWRKRQAEMAAAGPEWEVYFRGGLDALDTLADDLQPH